MTLEPVRRALIGAARERAEATAGAARAEAAHVLATARAEADALLEEARAAGAADGAAHLRRADVEARRDSRRMVLEARRRAHEEVRRRVRAAALDLRRDPGYPALLDRLGATVAARLGPGAELTVDPPESGGVVGRRGSSAVDCTLAAVADRCADESGDLLEELWR